MTFRGNKWMVAVALLALGCLAIFCFPKAPKHDDWALFHSTHLRSVKCRAIEVGQLEIQSLGEEYEIPIEHWATIESLVLPARRANWYDKPKHHNEGLRQIVLERKTGEKIELVLADHALLTTFWRDGVLYENDIDKRYINSLPVTTNMDGIVMSITRFVCGYLDRCEGGLDKEEERQNQLELGRYCQRCRSSPKPWKKGYIGE